MKVTDVLTQKQALKVTYVVTLPGNRCHDICQLISKGYTLVDTALEAGFADQSHLTRQFKSLFGITPGEFKRQIYAQK
jgi:AraC-like DNA-binding protein